MPDYQNGKIYKIISQHTDKCYVGSTTVKYLSERLNDHNQKIKIGKPTTASKIIELGDYQIILVELCPCDSKDELRMKERHYIETMDCVNKYCPIRQPGEYDKVNYKKNKESILKRKAIKITCECGRVICNNNISEHRKTKRHIKLMESQSSL